jgi:hypothetical protein
MQKAIYEKLKINWTTLPQTKLEVTEGSIL